MNRVFSSFLLVGLVAVALGTAGYELVRPGVTQVRAAPVAGPAVAVSAPAAVDSSKHDSVQLLVAGFPRALGGAVAVAKDMSAEVSETGSGHGDRELQVILRRGDPAAPVADATVIADGSMRSMSHDSFRVGSTPLGNGAYELTLPFTMDGQWDVVLTISAGTLRGNVTLSIDVGGGS